MNHPVKYTPPFAPHVFGSYTARTLGPDGIPDEQKVEAYCTTCQTTFKRTCASGMVRKHIATFALVHLHKDPLETKKP